MEQGRILQQLSGDDEKQAEWLHGGDVIAGQLQEEGVKHIFTLTGGHISGIYNGACRLGIRLVDFRHEQAAVFAADAYARLTLSPAVAALTAGPGIVNGLTGIANAFYANSPVVVLGGRNPFALGNSGNLQDAPTLELTRPITKFSDAIYDPWRTGHILREAFEKSLTPRFGPSYVDVPMDVQLTQMGVDDAPPVRKKHLKPLSYPDPGLVSKVAKLLAKSKNAVVVAGSGVYWDQAGEALGQFACLAKIPVYVNGMARGILEKDHPYITYVDRKASLLRADVIILLGVDLDFRFGYGQAHVINPAATVVQVDSDPTAIGKHRHVEIGVLSNIHQFLMSLIKLEKAFAKRAGTDMTAFKSSLQRRELKWKESLSLPDKPVNPLRFVYEVASFIDDDTIVIGDGGDIVALFAEYYRASKPGHWMDPGPFGCLGIGVPFAIGARLAKKDKPVLVISGDGSFGFNGFEIDSAVRQKLPFVLIIGNDGAWGEMRTFHEDIFGPEDPSAQYLSQSTRYETIVEGLGGYGQRVEKASEIVPALKRAFDSGVPAVINVILDPAYRRDANTISGKHVALAYGNGDPNAFIR